MERTSNDLRHREGCDETGGLGELRAGWLEKKLLLRDREEVVILNNSNNTIDSPSIIV